MSVHPRISQFYLNRCIIHICDRKIRLGYLHFRTRTSDSCSQPVVPCYISCNPIFPCLIIMIGHRHRYPIRSVCLLLGRIPLNVILSVGFRPYRNLHQAHSRIALDLVHHHIKASVLIVPVLNMDLPCRLLDLECVCPNIDHISICHFYIGMNIIDSET